MDAVAHDDLAIEFDRHAGGQNGSRVVSSLSHGFTVLRNLLFQRINDDVERAFGADSMVMPVSFLAGAKQTRLEIELFQVATAVDRIRAAHYVADPDPWLADWLTRLRFAKPIEGSPGEYRLREYLQRNVEERQLLFSDVLVRSFPASERAPLVLFRLFPLSVEIATALAFGDHLGASELRNRQAFLLPAISDCHECHGRPLENGEKCALCGNPVWTYAWLTAVD
jgi:hypothetical protein